MKIRDIQSYNQKQQQIYKEKTGIDVDIMNIGKNTCSIALQAKPMLEEIEKDVWLKTEVIEFNDGNFTNVYNVSWNHNNPTLTPHIHSTPLPYYQLDAMEDDPSLIASINGTYFFLIDVKEKEPKDFPFHFCISDSKVVGLPSRDEPVIYIKEKKLYSYEPKAMGTIRIAHSTVTWVGSHSVSSTHQSADMVLYNSASTKLIKEFDKESAVRMAYLNNNDIYTPSSTDVVDLIVNLDINDVLKISDIKYGGGSHYFDGLFILQIKKAHNKYSLGDEVIPQTLDQLDLHHISAGLSIGKNVKDNFFMDPIRENNRDARSVIAKDIRGNIHFIVFDGSKYIPKFKGVSANEVESYFSNDKYEWAYFLDGGSSSRIILKDKDTYRLLANEFAFRKITNQIFLWNWKRYRKIPSIIALKSTKK